MIIHMMLYDQNILFNTNFNDIRVRFTVIKEHKLTRMISANVVLHFARENAWAMPRTAEKSAEQKN